MAGFSVICGRPSLLRRPIRQAGLWRARGARLLAGLALGALAACGESAPQASDPPVRGLLTTTVAATQESVLRRYPGVLEPTEITALSFEVAGRLGQLDLSVGQRVRAGDVLAALNAEQFEIEIDRAAASVSEAEATAAQADADLARAEELLRRGSGTRVARDTARTNAATAKARLRQAQEALSSAEENLADAVLTAPFDGIVNSVDADSFATVGAGAAILSLYATASYEVSFSVNFDTVSDLVVGTPALVRLADDPSVALRAVVSELGERADTVSSFPVAVELLEQSPILKAGMAVEVSFEFQLPTPEGFQLPITAAVTDGQVEDGAGPRSVTRLPVFVFDPDTSTVKRRIVTMAGIRENKLLIIDGLEIGEKVAVAGVSFLRDGMTVRPIERQGVVD